MRSSPLRPQRLYRQQKGFSLTEAVVGVALLGLVILAVTQLSTLLSNSLRIGKESVDFNILMSRVNSWIVNEHACRLAMGGANSSGGPTSSITQTFNAVGPFTDIRLFMPVPATPPSTRPVFLDPASATNNKFQSWTVTSIRLAAIGTPAPSSHFPASLRIEAEGPAGAQRVSRELRLTLTTDAAWNIVSCAALSYTTDKPVPICDSDASGAVYAPSTDGTKVECLLIKCPTGTTPSGVDAYGDLICL